MRLIPSDPDVATIVGRIDKNDIDLQPDFQRGEVWGKAKKQRLIDSILRDWHVPPIHVIENPKTKKQEVLDGQQRLVAIRDFARGRFAVDGTIEPPDPEIASLDGKHYDELGDEWRRRFDQFSIRVFRLVEYQPSEPGELFYRLNQPTNLTGAEQRNAFFGPVREQIKTIVSALQKSGLDKQFLGFSNSRMAYDDVLSRTALAVERNSLAEKITAANLADLYRQDVPLSERTLSLMNAAADILVSTKAYITSAPRFNKATLFSWMIFLVRAHVTGSKDIGGDMIAAFLGWFEAQRSNPMEVEQAGKLALPPRFPWLFKVYEDRASARVADVSSVILRDAVIWTCFDVFCSQQRGSHSFPESVLNRLSAAWSTLDGRTDEDVLTSVLVEGGWGTLS